MTSQDHDHGLDASQQMLCIVDATGCLSDIGVCAVDMLGWDSSHRGTPLQDAVHPDDAPRLMVALGHSATDRRPAILDMRMRGRAGGWARVRCQVSPLADHNPPTYALAIRLSPTHDERTPERAARFEGHLWRIALEVQAARIGDRSSLREAWWSAPELAELSERQADVLRRIVQGERVTTIARELGVTESTVRNHLSSIYERFGVHSQAGLMSRLMRSDP